MERIFRPFLFGGSVFTLFLCLSVLTLWQVENLGLLPGLRKVERSFSPSDSSLETKESIDETQPHTLTLEVGYGDTLAKMLSEENVSAQEAHLAIQELQKYYSPRKLRPAHRLEITLVRPEAGASYKNLLELVIRTGWDQEYVVKRCNDGTFEIEALNVELQKQEKYIKITIDDNKSLYTQLAQQGVPHSIISELIRVYSYSIDFQRHLKTGDHCEVYYSQYHDPKSGRHRAGELIFANLKLKKGDYPVYQFKNKTGEVGYYNAAGQSVRKALLRTPLDGARISSHFSLKRRHPILGFTRAHKGVDFAAPIGTPIMAAGSGVIKHMGWFKGYGRYIRIQHNGEYSTAYAHLSRFKKGLMVGSRIQQGEVIGYVGSSGISSGPHLHFELLRYNQQIDPLRLKVLPTAKLSGPTLISFNQVKSEIDSKRKKTLS